LKGKMREERQKKGNREGRKTERDGKREKGKKERKKKEKLKKKNSSLLEYTEEIY